jgi:hypothetical protein
LDSSVSSLAHRRRFVRPPMEGPGKNGATFDERGVELGILGGVAPVAALEAAFSVSTSALGLRLKATAVPAPGPGRAVPDLASTVVWEPAPVLKRRRSLGRSSVAAVSDVGEADTGGGEAIAKRVNADGGGASAATCARDGSAQGPTPRWLSGDWKLDDHPAELMDDPSRLVSGYGRFTVIECRRISP